MKISVQLRGAGHRIAALAVARLAADIRAREIAQPAATIDDASIKAAANNDRSR